MKFLRRNVSLHKYIDSHCHITLYNESELSLVQERLKSQKIEKIILAGYDPEDWKKQKKLQDTEDLKFIRAFGLHPWYVCEAEESILNKDLLLLALQRAEFHFLGEIGLDFSTKERNAQIKKQKKYFRTQMQLAEDLKKPIVLHSVKAIEATQEILADFNREEGGIAHSFHGSLAFRDFLLKKNMILSFGPSILKWDTEPIAELIRTTPLAHLTMESDAPDQAQDSSVVFLIAQKIARLHKVSEEDVLQASWKNMQKLLSSTPIK